MAAVQRPQDRQGGGADVRRKQLRRRNLALLAALLGFAVLVYIVAIVRMSGG
ncbi:MAG: hypothetical protein BroJett029_40730 [Alphaproteobacteria bacterium]|nr:MAG: hypothetical protein BroJett029_40730 [Alphaproteobacteria bacterium]